MAILRYKPAYVICFLYQLINFADAVFDEEKGVNPTFAIGVFVGLLICSGVYIVAGVVVDIVKKRQIFYKVIQTNKLKQENTITPMTFKSTSTEESEPTTSVGIEGVIDDENVETSAPPTSIMS